MSMKVITDVKYRPLAPPPLSLLVLSAKPVCVARPVMANVRARREELFLIPASRSRRRGEEARRRGKEKLEPV